LDAERFHAFTIGRGVGGVNPPGRGRRCRRRW
jgi:hypothetical protein